MLKVITRNTTVAVIALLAGAAGLATAGGDGKCTVATKGDSPVAQACSRGGRGEAKKVMKAAVKAAKQKGGKFSCDDCHKGPDTENFDLKPNARDDFKKLMELASTSAPQAPAK